MPKPVLIIHFQPLELYPPVMNFICFIGNAGCDKAIVVSTKYNKDKPATFVPQQSCISIKRFGFTGQGIPAISRYLQYFKFYGACLYELLKNRPEKILYFESLSSFPVYLYKKFINRNAGIFIHYHEYTSVPEYGSGMRMVRYFHRKERWLYRVAQWISHTNEERLMRFLADEGLQRNNKCHVLPNYPSEKWRRRNESVDDFSLPRRIVYAGAVSRETMYFEQFVNWVAAHKGFFTFDIYSFNISESDAIWLQQYDVNYVRFHKGVDYNLLPGILKDYHIGVVLYKGHIPNYVLNAPNKLFEYLACGLDVWVPGEMTGCAPFYTKDTYPKVIAVNFRELDRFNWQNAISKEGLTVKESEWYFEQIYPSLVNELFEMK